MSNTGRTSAQGPVKLLLVLLPSVSSSSFRRGWWHCLARENGSGKTSFGSLLAASAKSGNSNSIPNFNSLFKVILRFKCLGYYCLRSNTLVDILISFCSLLKHKSHSLKYSIHEIIFYLNSLYFFKCPVKHV